MNNSLIHSPPFSNGQQPFNSPTREETDIIAAALGLTRIRRVPLKGDKTSPQKVIVKPRVKTTSPLQGRRAAAKPSAPSALSEAQATDAFGPNPFGPRHSYVDRAVPAAMDGTAGASLLEPIVPRTRRKYLDGTFLRAAQAAERAETRKKAEEKKERVAKPFEGLRIVGFECPSSAPELPQEG